MKSLKDTMLNESRTRFEDIQNYGESWINEWGLDYFVNVLSFFVKGMKKGLNENSRYFIKDKEDEKFIKRCTDFINKLEEDINKKIY